MHKPTAGQASLEYVGAIALVAAVLLVAAPAVGAPDIPRTIVHKLRLGVCLVADDICSDAAARAAGVAPCPLESDVGGGELTFTFFSVELGGRATVTVTPSSDGTVSAVWSSGVSVGVSGGWGAGLSAGPITLDVGASGALRERVSASRGWTFPDQETADRFLDGLEHHVLDEQHWPAAWHSVEGGAEASAMVGATLGGADLGGIDLVGVAASGQLAVGGKLTREGLMTLYIRVALDGPELAVPLLTSAGRGRNDLLAEYTFGRDGPRELVFRRADTADMGNRVKETVARLDLRDPANYAVARPLIETGLPWPADAARDVKAALARIRTHGVIEQSVSEVDDDSRGVSGSFSDGLKFGAGGRKIKVHKQLIEATARTGGPRERERFDCTA